MLGDARIECVECEMVLALYQAKAAGRYNDMDIAGFGADGTIAVFDFNGPGQRDLEPDSAAMTPSFMYRHLLQFMSPTQTAGRLSNQGRACSS